MVAKPAGLGRAAAGAGNGVPTARNGLVRPERGERKPRALRRRPGTTGSGARGGVTSWHRPPLRPGFDVRLRFAEERAVDQSDPKLYPGACGLGFALHLSDAPDVFAVAPGTSRCPKAAAVHRGHPVFEIDRDARVHRAHRSGLEPSLQTLFCSRVPRADKPHHHPW